MQLHHTYAVAVADTVAREGSPHDMLHSCIVIISM